MTDDPYTAGADGIETERVDAPGVDAGRADNDLTDTREDEEEPPESKGSIAAASRDRDDDPPPEGGGDTPVDCDPDHDDCDDHDDRDCDREPLAYRLERLRLWRAVVTLAAVLARLIRSL